MAKQKTNKFRDAVLATPEVQACFKPDLQALGRNSSKVELDNIHKVEGSVDLDACTTKQYPDANRWDYAFGYDGASYFVEVHPAESGEVSRVLRKLQWLKDWLNSKAPDISKIRAKNKTPYYWIQSGRFNIPKTTSQYRKLVQEGLLPIPKLKL